MGTVELDVWDATFPQDVDETLASIDQLSAIFFQLPTLTSNGRLGQYAALN